jgi:hypothetical protein
MTASNDAMPTVATFALGVSSIRLAIVVEGASPRWSCRRGRGAGQTVPGELTGERLGGQLQRSRGDREGWQPMPSTSSFDSVTTVVAPRESATVIAATKQSTRVLSRGKSDLVGPVVSFLVPPTSRNVVPFTCHFSSVAGRDRGPEARRGAQRSAVALSGCTVGGFVAIDQAEAWLRFVGRDVESDPAAVSQLGVEAWTHQFASEGGCFCIRPAAPRCGASGPQLRSGRLDRPR